MPKKEKRTAVLTRLNQAPEKTMQAREEGATYEAASAGHGAPFTTKRVRGKCTLITRCRKHIGQYQLCVIVIKYYAHNCRCYTFLRLAVQWARLRRHRHKQVGHWAVTFWCLRHHSMIGTFQRHFTRPGPPPCVQTIVDEKTSLGGTWWRYVKQWFSGLVQEPAASASPGNSLEIQIPGPTSDSLNPKLGGEAAICVWWSPPVGMDARSAWHLLVLD